MALALPVVWSAVVKPSAHPLLVNAVGEAFANLASYVMVKRMKRRKQACDQQEERLEWQRELTTATEERFKEVWAELRRLGATDAQDD